MRALYIGDIHGKTDWKWVLSSVNEFDKIVFVGDYVDSFTISSSAIIKNLRDIIAFKIKHPDKVELLLGNHDYAYVFNRSFTSGFRPEAYLDIKRTFDENWDLFNVAWGYDDGKKYTLATHAGLTNTYKVDYVDSLFEETGSLLSRFYESKEDYESAPIHEVLNLLKDNMMYLWVVSYSRGGSFNTGSVIWADKHNLLTDHFPGIDQVVGHTASHYVQKFRGKSEEDIYFIDRRSDETTFFLALDL